MIQVKNPQDFWAGVLFVVVGAIALWHGWKYPVGTIRQMGPGFVPRALSWTLLGIGAFLALRSVRAGGARITPCIVRAQVFILLSIVVFGLTIERFGLAPAVVVATIVAALASRQTKWTETLALAILFAVASVLLFITLLGQSMQPWAWSL